MLQPEMYEPAQQDVIVRRDDAWGWLEVFVLVQVFWGILLFLPGSQALPHLHSRVSVCHESCCARRLRPLRRSR